MSDALSKERIVELRDNVSEAVRTALPTITRQHKMRETILALIAERDEWINDVHPTSLRGVWHDLRTRHARFERENAALLKVADALREQHVRDRIALNRLCDYFDSSAETADDRWQMKRLLDAWKAGDQVSGQP